MKTINITPTQKAIFAKLLKFCQENKLNIQGKIEFAYDNDNSNYPIFDIDLTGAWQIQKYTDALKVYVSLGEEEVLAIKGNKKK